MQWVGDPTPTTISFAQLISGTIGNANVGRLSSGVNTTVTYQIGDNTGDSPNFGGIIQNGSGTVVLNKIGSNTQILSGNNTYTGATTVNGGTLSLAGTSGSSTFTVNSGSLVFNNTSAPLTATTPTAIINGGSITTNVSLSNLSVSVNSGGTFKTALSSSLNNIDVGSTTNGSMVVAGGAAPAAQGIVSMVDGVVGTMNLYSPSGASALTVGGLTVGNPSILNFELGQLFGSPAADKIALGFGSKFTVNPGGATINISGIPGFGTGDFPLITFDSGAKTGAGGFTLGSTPGGLFTYSLDTSLADRINLHVGGNPVPTIAYWRGNLSGSNGTVWNANSGTTTNWSSDPAGTTDTGQIPGGVSTVFFVANNANLGNLNTTLGSDIGVSGLNFTSLVGPTHPVTIGGPNKLTIGFGGITIDSGSGAHTISTSGLVIGNSQSWSNNSTSTFTVSAPLSGGDSSTYLTLSGSGLFVLSGASTYSGNTSISTGTTLRIGNASALGTGSTTVDGTLDINGLNLTANGLSGIGIVTNNNATPATVAFGGSSVTTFSGMIQNGSGTVGIVKSGPGTVSLASSNNYTGGTNINGGVLNVGNTNALGATGNISFTGGTIQYASAIVADHSSRIKNSTGAISIDTSMQDVTYAGVIDSSNTGGLTALGGGTLILSGANAYAGNNTINAGTLKVGNASALGNAANALSIGSAGILDLNGQTIAQSTVALGAMTTGIITNSNTSTPATLNADIMNFQGGLTLNSPGDIAFKRIDQAAGDANGRIINMGQPCHINNWHRKLNRS